MNAMEMTVQYGEATMDENKASEITQLEKLLQDYGNNVYRTCCLYLKDSALAEDAAQETFIRAYEKLGTLKDQEAAKSWILKISINICKNYLRSNWIKKVDLGEIAEQSNLNDTEQDLLKQEQQQEMLSAVYGLKEKYKEIIILYYYQDLKTSEIAEVLSISESLVRMRLHRGKQTLKKKLREVEFYEYR